MSIMDNINFYLVNFQKKVNSLQLMEILSTLYYSFMIQAIVNAHEVSIEFQLYYVWLCIGTNPFLAALILC